MLKATGLREYAALFPGIMILLLLSEAFATQDCSAWCMENDHGVALNNQCVNVGSCLNGNLYTSACPGTFSGCCCNDKIPITFITPNNQYFSSDSVVIRFNIPQTSAEVSRKLDRGQWITVCTNCKGNKQITLNGLQDGSHVLKIKAVSQEGFDSQEQLAFTVDTQPPTIQKAGDNSGGQVLEGTDVKIYVKWSDTNLINSTITVRDGSGNIIKEDVKIHSSSSKWHNLTISTQGLGGKTLVWSSIAFDKAGNYMQTDQYGFNIIETTQLIIEKNWKFAQPGGDVDVELFKSVCDDNTITGQNSQVFYFDTNGNLKEVRNDDLVNGKLKYEKFSQTGGLIFKSEKTNCTGFRYPSSSQPLLSFNAHWNIVDPHGNANLDELDRRCGQYSQVFYFDDNGKLQTKTRGVLPYSRIFRSGGIIIKAINTPCSVPNLVI